MTPELPTSPAANEQGSIDAEGMQNGDARFAALCDALPQMVWATLPDGAHYYYNAQWYEFTGVPVGSTDGAGWAALFHPDDQSRAWKRWSHSLSSGEPYEVEYRLRHHSGTYRWTLGRALPVRDKAGQITHWIGTCTDIDDQKRTAEQNEILSRELSHRIKNIFAVIGGLIALSARREPAVKGFADELRGRVAALGRAHEFVRPHSDESRPIPGESTLMTMLHDLLSAYPAHDAGRLSIVGDDVPLDDRGATPIALVFHELATNAAKYGALSVPDGEVQIRSQRKGDSVEIVWSEHGGPSVTTPVHEGFGTRLVQMSVVQQLGGTLDRAWRADGLQVTIGVRADRLARR